MDKRLRELLRTLLEELTSLIEEDDGTVFQVQHIEIVEELSDIMEETQ